MMGVPTHPTARPRRELVKMSVQVMWVTVGLQVGVGAARASSWVRTEAVRYFPHLPARGSPDPLQDLPRVLDTPGS